MKKRLRIFALFILLLCGSGELAVAQTASSWIMDPYTRSRLIVGNFDSEKKILHLGWQVILKEGWKTYWRSPGDAGLPPRWNWGTSPENIKSIKVDWPAPERMHIFNMDTFIYHDEVILPIRLELADATRPLDISLDLEFMICQDVCIPLEAHYELNIPDVGQMKASFFQAALLQKYQQKVPALTADKKVRLSVTELEKKSFLRIGLSKEEAGLKDIIIEGPEGYAFGKITAIKDKKGRERQGQYMVAIYSDQRAKEIKGRTLTLTLIPENGPAIEIEAGVED